MAQDILGWGRFLNLRIEEVQGRVVAEVDARVEDGDEALLGEWLWGAPKP